VDLDGFGDADDVVFPTPPTDAIFSRIASVSIKGIITGTGSTAGDQYGFTAQQIGAFRFRRDHALAHDRHRSPAGPHFQSAQAPAWIRFTPRS